MADDTPGDATRAATGALDGVRVLSIGHTLPGLYCLAMLRDLGATVLRVERPPAGDGDPYEALAGQFPVRSLVAGTAQVTLDLKTAGGTAWFRTLAARADVVLDGFRPGTAARLGIDHATLAAVHPALVYVAISGFGQDGPARDVPGHDVNYLAATGVLDVSGAADGPPAFPGVTVADGLAGLSAAVNVLAALRRRDRAGVGAFVDVAIVDGPLFLMQAELEHYWSTGVGRRRGDTHLSGRWSWYHVCETADGRWLALGAVEPKFFARLCDALGCPELAAEQFADGAVRDTLNARIRAVVRTRTLADWQSVFAGRDVCAMPVRMVAEVAAAPEHARAFVRSETGGPLMVRTPVRIGDVAAGGDDAAARADWALSAADAEALVWRVDPPPAPRR